MNPNTLQKIKITQEKIKELNSHLAKVPREIRESSLFDAHRSLCKELNDELFYAKLALEKQKKNPDATFLDFRFRKNKNEDDLDSGISAAFLGEFLQIWQNNYNALGKAAESTSSKKLPSQISASNQTFLKVRAFSYGSFVVRMSLDLPPLEKSGYLLPAVVEDPDLLGIRAFEVFKNLVGEGTRKESLTHFIKKLSKERVVINYMKLLNLLVDNEFDFSAALFSPTIDEMMIVRLPFENTVHIKKTFSEILELQHEDVKHFAMLTAANIKNGSFELDLIREQGSPTIKGKVDMENQDLLRGCILGESYYFTLSKKIETKATTEKENTTYILKNIEK